MLRVDSKTAEIVIGQRVYCGLRGGSYGIVSQIYGQQSAASCQTIGGMIRYGGTATFDVVFPDHISRQLPECILRGVQWEIFAEVATADELAAALAECEAAQERERLRKIAADDQHQAEVSELQSHPDYSHLDKIGDKHAGGVAVAKNIRKQLKKHFPGFKFRVTSDYNSVNIRWEDGPTVKQVEPFVEIFKAGSFNGMEDIYEFHRSAFCEVYGGCKYVFCTRDLTEDAKKKAFLANFPDGLNYCGESFTELPANYWNTQAGDFIRRKIYGTAFDKTGEPSSVTIS